jgi:hydroxymethylbilane synthase
MTATPVRIATRGSKLALAQAGQVRDRLAAAFRDRTFELHRVQTTGDVQLQWALAAAPGKGVFVKEIEEALLAGEAALAVHSLKDLPTDMPAALVLGAVPAREDPRDVLVGPQGYGISLDALRHGARVGTGSPRRACQLRASRPDLDVQDIRGNVDTRLRRLRDGDYDAIMLAAAGLNRLGLGDVARECLPADVFLPAVGQGALALQVRADDAATRALVAALHDPATAAAVTAERSLLRALGGGCAVPVAAHGRIEGGALVLDGLVATPDGREVVRARGQGPSEDAEALGAEVAARLSSLGAMRLLDGR